MDQKKYWMGFNLVKGIGAVRLKALLNYFGDLEIAWNAPTAALRSAGLNQRIIDQFQLVRSGVDLDQVWERILSRNIQILTWDDDIYPALLKEVDQPPPVLYVRGNLIPADGVAVAIVGTRRLTMYGKQVTDELAAYLSHHGVTIISGLARGVDAVAHDAALKSGGRTIAVLGSGVDVIYPPEHQHLADQIIQQGAVISDYPPGTPPDGINFPPRNRIISGLALATVIVEAGDKSGALITASFAANQGRDVLAVPGSIYAPQSKGTNRLIQQGARPMLSPEDVLEAIDIEYTREHHQARLIFPADEVESRIMQTLGDQPAHIDEISHQLDLPIEKVSATLTLMELKGMVNQVGGMNYVIARESSADYMNDPDN